jgi:hypothetical protein
VNNSDTSSVVVTVDQFEVNCTCCVYVDVPETAVSPTSPPTIPPQPMANNSNIPPTPTPAPVDDVSSPNDTTIRSFIEDVAPSGGGVNDPNSQTADAEEQAIQWLEENGSRLQFNVQDPGSRFRIQQWYALLTLYYSTNGMDWMDPWELSDIANECDLVGVQCEEVQDATFGEQSAVVNISLSNNSLMGRLSPDLALLPYLQYLDVSLNSLVGTIPEALITSTMNMTHFVAGSNNLTGTLSTLLGLSWSNIQIFNVSTNQLSGPIPESLSNWTNATLVDLSMNQLNGTIPDGLCDWEESGKLIVDSIINPCAGKGGQSMNESISI